MGAGGVGVSGGDAHLDARAALATQGGVVGCGVIEGAVWEAFMGEAGADAGLGRQAG